MVNFIANSLHEKSVQARISQKFLELRPELVRGLRLMPCVIDTPVN